MSLSRNRKPPAPSRVGFAGNFRSLLWGLSHLGGEATSRQRGEVTIARLFSGSGPSTVVRPVVAVVVDAIKRMGLRGATAHVGQERLERIAPAVTHADSASAIVSIVDVTRIGAARFHAFPDFILGCGFAHGPLSVFLIWASLAVFSLQTTAAFDATGAQIAGAGCPSPATIATAFPQDAPVGEFLDKPQDNQSLESLTRQINIGHSMSLTRVYVAL